MANGYRVYESTALDRVMMVRRALAIGFSLDELGEVLRVRERGGAPCRRVRELAAQKLSDVEEQLADILRIRDELQSTLKDWDAQLERSTPGTPSRLLEALASSQNHKPLPAAQGKRNLRRKGVRP
jgi:DNA-binding transcriptional MerR regulator